jgi:hypothetical protein
MYASSSKTEQAQAARGKKNTDNHLAAHRHAQSMKLKMAKVASANLGDAFKLLTERRISPDMHPAEMEELIKEFGENTRGFFGMLSTTFNEFPLPVAFEMLADEYTWNVNFVELCRNFEPVPSVPLAEVIHAANLWDEEIAKELQEADDEGVTPAGDLDLECDREQTRIRVNDAKATVEDLLLFGEPEGARKYIQNQKEMAEKMSLDDELAFWTELCKKILYGEDVMNADDEQPTSDDVINWMRDTFGGGEGPKNLMRCALEFNHPENTVPAVRMLYAAALKKKHGSLNEFVSWAKNNPTKVRNAYNGKFTPRWCCTRCENKQDNYVCEGSWKECVDCHQVSPLLLGEPYTPC